MSLSTPLLLSTCALLVPCVGLRAQDQAAQKAEPVLSKSDHDALRSRLQEYYSARDDLENADDRRRATAQKKLDKAKEALEKTWESKSGKKNPLASVPDLEAIFNGCFEFERQTGTGDLRSMKAKDRWPTYDYVLSKKYRADAPAPTVLLLRGHIGDKGWTPARNWYEATWKAAPQAADYVFVLPELDESIDFDPPVDLAKEEGLVVDDKRTATVLMPLGAANQTFNVDRNRIYMDCGKGSCAYALRLGTYFPNLLAGMVLRSPTDPGDLLLDNLRNVPILLLRTEATKDVCDELAKKLNALGDGKATVLDAKGDYPHAESAADIAAWMAQREREMFPSTVVVANTHDRFRKAFWVLMGTAEPVLSGKRPRLEVSADRASNKVTVTATNVRDFVLMLNDAIVDLDKEITTIINGKAQPPFKVERSLNKLLNYVEGPKDPGMLFVAERGFRVPEEEKPADAEKAGDEKTTKGEGSPPK